MNRNVLFVDDESSALDAYRRQMRNVFKIEKVQGADAALQLLAQGDFAVVVSDRHLPGTDGNDFLTQVARRWPNVVRVMLTRSEDVRDASAAVRAGHAFRFLTRPCVPDALMMVLESAVREHASLVQVASAAAATASESGLTRSGTASSSLTG
jgi:DNA-binding NtrC family response regulator